MERVHRFSRFTKVIGEDNLNIIGKKTVLILGLWCRLEIRLRRIREVR